MIGSCMKSYVIFRNFMLLDMEHLERTILMDLEQLLREKINKRTLRIAIIGLGYVVLPLAVTFAEAGFHVTGIDVDQHKVEAANRGESYIADISSSTLQKLIETKKLHFTSDYAVLDDMDALSICVPTPLSKTRDPDISYIISATQQVRDHLNSGQLIILESTTYPGTTEEVMLPIGSYRIASWN
jgi:UDP-N-acetyl-D-glucosamine dehydrogenase